jgi:hypothetical protein
MILWQVKVYLLDLVFGLPYLIDSVAPNHALKRSPEESATGADKSLCHGDFRNGAIRQESDDTTLILVKA